MSKYEAVPYNPHVGVANAVPAFGHIGVPNGFVPYISWTPVVGDDEVSAETESKFEFKLEEV